MCGEFAALLMILLYGVSFTRTAKSAHCLPGDSMYENIFWVLCSTILVEPGWLASITADHNVRLDVCSKDSGVESSPVQQELQQPAGPPERSSIDCDPIQLSIFSHRYDSHAFAFGCRYRWWQVPYTLTGLSRHIRVRIAPGQWTCLLTCCAAGLHLQVYGNSRADGQGAAAHLYQRQHQGAARLQLCFVWSRRCDLMVDWLLTPFLMCRTSITLLLPAK